MPGAAEISGIAAPINLSRLLWELRRPICDSVAICCH